MMNFQENSADDTPQVIEQMSETETGEIHENNTSFDLIESNIIHSDLLYNRT